MIDVYLVTPDLAPLAADFLGDHIRLVEIERNGAAFVVPPPRPDWNARALITDPDQADAVSGAASVAGFAGIPVLAVAATEPQALARALLTLLSDARREAEEDAAEARAAAALLRKESQALNRQFRSVENFLHALGNPEYSVALSWPAGPSVIELAEGQTLTQKLPVNVLGTAAADLWLPEGLLTPDALEIQLLDTAGNAYGLSPLLPAAGAGAGWLRFVLPEPVNSLPADCSLRMTWAGADTLAIGLGLPVPDVAFAAHAGTLAQPATLALRLWKSLPGVRLPPVTPLTPSGQMTGLQAGALILPSALPAPAIFSQPSSATDFMAVEFWHKEDAVFIHPSASGAVCAIIRDIEVGSVTHLSALVNVGHDRSPVLNFAIGAAPQGAVDADGYWQRRLGPWLTGLPPRAWGEAHCIPVEPVEGRMDILLAVTLAGGGPNDMSWGMFRGFRIGQQLPEDLPL
ncbi:DUF6212 domain-containing protein [Halodurantibacterium flavum]|uniref:DUF6212 domain-containing protein n=1 Tax=Halodurantibacterium flavum TaxID=1382802 RepID=A0ABW4S1T2_9RHOB